MVMGGAQVPKGVCMVSGLSICWGHADSGIGVTPFTISTQERGPCLGHMPIQGTGDTRNRWSQGTVFLKEAWKCFQIGVCEGRRRRGP